MPEVNQGVSDGSQANFDYTVGQEMQPKQVTALDIQLAEAQTTVPDGAVTGSTIMRDQPL